MSLALLGLLFGVGLVVGSLGTLVGAGGGFLLVPVLLWLYPGEPAATLAASSLVVVFFNALSGSLGYARLGRIDWRASRWFAASAVPGGLAGVWLSHGLERRGFTLALGVLLGLAGLHLALARDTLRPPRFFRPTTHVELRDAAGNHYAYGYHRGLALVFSFATALVATVLGVGGGIFHVSGMVGLLGMPIEIATATSHLVLAITAFTGSALHVVLGEMHDTWTRSAVLGCGALLGAQLGTLLAHRLAARTVRRVLALALLAVAARLLAGGAP